MTTEGAFRFFLSVCIFLVTCVCTCACLW